MANNASGGSSRFEKIISLTRKFFGAFVRRTKYDLWEDIMSNDIAKSPNPSKAAVEWLRNYIKDPDTRIVKRAMNSCQLYIFDYDTPKYEDVLEFFDTQPLIISLGTTLTSNGIRELGINLHLLPPRVRKLVMYRIFNMYKIHYMKNMHKRQVSFDIDWQPIKKACEDLGVSFAVRMYIPELRKNTILIRQEFWPQAAWIPSKKYSKITAVELEKKWREFVKEKKVNGVIGESHL